MTDNATKSKSKAKRRLSPEQSRQAALEAARHILIQQGPRAVTLKAVASAIGRTHANLLHHFGSAFELQQALVRHICARIIRLVGQSMSEFRKNRDVEHTADQVIRFTFDAFDSEGGGPLAAWMITNGQPDAFDPVLDTIVEVVKELQANGTIAAGAERNVVQLLLVAFGNSILGPQLSGAFGLESDLIRNESCKMLAERLTLAKAKTGEK